MPATRPSPETLTAEHIALEPLTDEHLPALWQAIGSAQVFEGGYGGGLSGMPADSQAFADFAHRYLQFGVGNPYAVILRGGPHDGMVVGTTTLADFDLANESAHIGWTAYDPRVWGTAVNASAKLLLLGLAFDNGFGRVKIQADAINERSRAAIAGLGATFEGVLRRVRRRPDGTWRDTAVYSILADEWPAVRERLQGRIAQQAGRPVLFRGQAAPPAPVN